MLTEEDENSEGLKPLKELRKKELVDSERSYLGYLTSLREASDNKYEVIGILGNLQEIIQLSKELIANLESWENEKDLIPLSTCFLPLKDKFIETYEAYCVQYQTNARKIEDSDEASRSELEASVTGLSLESVKSILIMPVQRIMRYPLILKGILKATNDEGEKEDLEKVYQVMRTIADDINEKKRQQEICEIHELRRRNARSSTVRISSMIFDIAHFGTEHSQVPETSPAFQELLNNFASLHDFSKTLKTRVLKVNRELAVVMDSALAVAESINVIYESKSEDSKLFLENSKKCKTETLVTIEKSINENVIIPLDELLTIFKIVNELVETRSGLIMKCKHINLSNNISSERSQHQKLGTAIRSYGAIHLQLSMELPIFLKSAEGILEKLSQLLLEGRKKILMTQAKHIYRLGHATRQLPDNGCDISSRYETAVQPVRLTLQNFSFVKENSEHTANTLLKNSPQEFSKFVTAISGFKASKTGEITVEKGDVLQLLSKKGQVSNVTLVGKKGCVPSCILRPYNRAIDNRNFSQQSLSARSAEPSSVADRTTMIHQKNEARGNNAMFFDSYKEYGTPRRELKRDVTKDSSSTPHFSSQHYGSLNSTSGESLVYPETHPPSYASLYPQITGDEFTSAQSRILPSTPSAVDLHGVANIETIPKPAPEFIPSLDDNSNPAETTSTKDLTNCPAADETSSTNDACEWVAVDFLPDKLSTSMEFVPVDRYNEMTRRAIADEIGTSEVVMRQRKQAPIPAPRRSRMFPSTVQAHSNLNEHQ